MTRNQFIKMLATGGAVITGGTYAGLSIKKIFHSYGNEKFGREIAGGIDAALGGKIPEGDLKKVAICDTDIPFIRGGLSMRGKNGETLSIIPAGSMVQIVFGSKPFRVYLLRAPDEEMNDKEYCVFRLAYSEFPGRCLPLWDGENGFKMYVEPRTLRARAAWWKLRNQMARHTQDIQMARFIEKATKGDM